MIYTKNRACSVDSHLRVRITLIIGPFRRCSRDRRLSSSHEFHFSRGLGAPLCLTTSNSTAQYVLGSLHRELHFDSPSVDNQIRRLTSEILSEQSTPHAQRTAFNHCRWSCGTAPASHPVALCLTTIELNLSTQLADFEQKTAVLIVVVHFQRRIETEYSSAFTMTSKCAPCVTFCFSVG